MPRLLSPVEAFDTIRAVAREHAMSQEVGTCICTHVQTVHVNHWGGCRGTGCSCPSFRGINWGKARLMERYGVALVARLRDQADSDLPRVTPRNARKTARNRKGKKG